MCVNFITGWNYSPSNKNKTAHLDRRPWSGRERQLPGDLTADVDKAPITVAPYTSWSKDAHNYQANGRSERREALYCKKRPTGL
jgi:hypothetical protein